MEAKANKKGHWEGIFKTKDTSKVSWFQEKPIISLKLIRDYTKNRNVSIIDVGAGDSQLPDYLLEDQFTNLTFLDISGIALELSKSRIQDKTHNLNWIETNILDFKAKTTFDLWHDRAVFHFISNPVDQMKYKEVLLNALAPSGIVIIAAFSKNGGPSQCSGIDICPHDKESFAKIFSPEFEIINNFENKHRTPSGAIQNFSWVVLKRKKR